MILNYITQDNNKVLGYERNETVKFHRLESLYFRVWLRRSNTMVDLRKNDPWQEKKPASKSNQEQGVDKSTKRQKGAEFLPTSVGVEASV